MTELKIEPGQNIAFAYINYRGEKSVRLVRVDHVFYGSTEWHKEPQFFLHGEDLIKGEQRSFAIRDISEVEVVHG